jgi:hypothetical protein
MKTKFLFDEKKTRMDLPDVCKFAFCSSRTTGFVRDTFPYGMKALPVVVSKSRFKPGNRT